MEQVLPYFLGTSKAKQWSSSHQTSTWRLGYSSYPLFTAACESGLLDEWGMSMYNAGKNPDSYMDLYPGYQSFVSSKNRSPSWNSCTNFKQYGMSLPWSAVTSMWDTPTTIYVLSGRERRISYAAGFMNESYLRGITPNDTTLSSTRAWNTMQPRFESDVDLLMSIGESTEGLGLTALFEQKRCSQAVSSLLFEKSGKPTKLSRLLRKAPKTGLSVLSGAVAEAWLAIGLAIMPTLSDTHNILSRMKDNIDHAQADFAQKGIDGNTRHYTEVLYDASDLSAGTYNNSHLQYGTSAKVTFTASLNYGYRYTLRDQVSAIQKYLGTHGSFSTLWEWVPLSFVADYFLTIGNAIKAMDRDKNVSDLTVFNYSESTLAQFRSGRFLNTDNVRVNLPIVDGTLLKRGSGVHHTDGPVSSLYNRVLTAPRKGMYVPRFKTPSTKQAATCLALVRMLI